MKVFVEDGSDGARITNIVIKRIYEEPQISTPKAAETLGRGDLQRNDGQQGVSRIVALGVFPIWRFIGKLHGMSEILITKKHRL